MLKNPSFLFSVEPKKTRLASEINVQVSHLCQAAKCVGEKKENERQTERQKER